MFLYLLFSFINTSKISDSKFITKLFNLSTDLDCYDQQKINEARRQGIDIYTKLTKLHLSEIQDIFFEGKRQQLGDKNFLQGQLCFLWNNLARNVISRFNYGAKQANQEFYDGVIELVDKNENLSGLPMYYERFVDYTNELINEL